MRHCVWSAVALVLVAGCMEPTDPPATEARGPAPVAMNESPSPVPAPPESDSGSTNPPASVSTGPGGSSEDPNPPIPPSGVTSSPLVDLELTVGGATQVVGNKLDIVVRVRNRSTEVIRDATVILKVNDSLRLDMATAGFRGWNDNPNELVWDLRRMEPSEPAVEYVAECECAASGSALPLVASLRLESGAILENKKTLTIRPASDGTAPATPPSDERATGGESPNLDVAVFDLLDPVHLGETCRYIIEVKNAGQTTARNVRVTVRLPESLALIQANTRPAFDVVGQDVIFNAIPSIPPGELRDFRVRARASKVSQASTVKVKVMADDLAFPFTKAESTEISPGETQGNAESEPSSRE